MWQPQGQRLGVRERAQDPLYQLLDIEEHQCCRELQLWLKCRGKIQTPSRFIHSVEVISVDICPVHEERGSVQIHYYLL